MGKETAAERENILRLVEDHTQLRLTRQYDKMVGTLTLERSDRHEFILSAALLWKLDVGDDVGVDYAPLKRALDQLIGVLEEFSPGQRIWIERELGMYELRHPAILLPWSTEVVEGDMAADHQTFLMPVLEGTLGHVSLLLDELSQWRRTIPSDDSDATQAAAEGALRIGRIALLHAAFFGTGRGTNKSLVDFLDAFLPATGESLTRESIRTNVLPVSRIPQGIEENVVHDVDRARHTARSLLARSAPPNV